jgi:hypothetical protein
MSLPLEADQNKIVGCFVLYRVIECKICRSIRMNTHTFHTIDTIDSTVICICIERQKFHHDFVLVTINQQILNPEWFKKILLRKL